jgi:hypothetical protein
MSEIVFVAEQDPEGGVEARSLGASILTLADDETGLHAAVRDAVRCHFDEQSRPSVIRLHGFRDEVIAA